MRDLARWAAVQRHDPDLLRLLVGRDVHGLHGERHPSAIGRNLRIADPLQLHHGIGVEGPLLGEGNRREPCNRDEFTMHTRLF